MDEYLHQQWFSAISRMATRHNIAADVQIEDSAIKVKYGRKGHQGHLTAFLSDIDTVFGDAVAPEKSTKLGKTCSSTKMQITDEDGLEKAYDEQRFTRLLHID